MTIIEERNLLDMVGVVHRNGTFSFEFRQTWCEAIDDETYFTSSSLRPTDKPVTCLRCLGLK